MEKEELFVRLKEKGFKTGVEDNIPYVYYNDEKSPLTEVRRIIKELGYTGTFGVKRTKQPQIEGEKQSA